jgi:hypothetical protein
MVAIQAVLTLAMAAVATAGTINTNLQFFTRTDNHQCNSFPGDPGPNDPVSIFNPPATGNQKLINQCIQHAAWGSVRIDNFGTNPPTGTKCECKL